jgi:FkbM family methyltransferase
MLSTLRGHTILIDEIGAAPFVIDLGAHRGEFSRLFSERARGTFILVEPNPELARGLPTYDGFSARWAAIAQADGEVTLNLARNAEGSSVLELPAHSDYGIVVASRVAVPALRLSTLIAELGAPRVDILKMDIEGLEGVALLDLTAKTLASIGQATVEFHSDPVFGLNLPVTVERAIAHMTAHGFVWFDFSAGLRRDVLFVNQSWHRLTASRVAGLKIRTQGPAIALGAWRRLPKGFRRVARRWVPRALWTSRG